MLPEKINGTFTPDEKNWSVLCHLSGLIPIPFLGVIVPFLVLLLKRQESTFIEFNAVQALNFQVSLLIYSGICIVLCFTVIGMPFGVIGFVASFILNIISIIRAALHTSKGSFFNYPYSLHLFN